MKRIVIFGAGDIAQLAHYYFTEDSDYEVVAFTVDGEYLSDETFCGLPVIAFDELFTRYPPEQFGAFVALSYTGLNALRRDKYLALKKLGYTLVSYVSSRCCVLNNMSIGENCFILEDNTIQPFTRIGDNVTLWSGNHIGHHSRIGDHTFVASHVVVSGGVEIGEECFIGVNATVRDHIVIGDRCIIGAGALLLDDAESGGLYVAEKTVRSRVPSNRIKNL